MAQHKKIENLTPEQVKILSEYKDKWLKNVVSTERADRKETEKWLKYSYDALKYKHPEYFLWVESPYAGVVASTCLKLDEEIHAEIKLIAKSGKFLDIDTSQKFTTNERVALSTWFSLRKIFFELGKYKNEETFNKAFDTVWITMAKQKVQNNLSGVVQQCVYGNQDSYWLYLYEVATLLYPDVKLDSLQGIVKIGEEVGWWWPFEKVCVVTERPTEIHLDKNNRLHNENGPAMGYSDGWGLYAVEGLSVPEKVVMNPQDLTPKEILDFQNVEVRRIALTRYGIDNFVINNPNTTTLDEDIDGGGQPRKLMRVDVGTNRPVIGVLVTDPSTGKKAFLPCDPKIKTCAEAVAKSFGFEKIADYSPDVET